MRYSIKGKEFIYVSDYRDNDELRNGFFELAKKVFCLDFEYWYNEGFWTKACRPCSLVHEGKVVANISVNFMNFNYLGEEKHYIQLGTVMTDPDYRNMGLSRIIMDKIISEWEEKCDSMYLLANDTVVDFYPKFGFEKALEYKHSMSAEAVTGDKYNVRKLDPCNINDRRIIIKRSNGKNPLAVLSTEHNSCLTMFYGLLFIKDNFFYIDELDAVVVAEYNNDILMISEIYCPEGVRLQTIISSMMQPEIKRIEFGFTPMDSCDCDEEVFVEEDTTLFVMNNMENLFKQDHIFLPALSNA